MKRGVGEELNNPSESKVAEQVINEEIDNDVTAKRSVEAFLNKVGNVNSAFKGGDTILHWAARKGFTETAKFLLERGADVKLIDKYGITPLHSAARYGNTAVAELLLQRGADINQVTQYGDAPLHSALNCSGHAVARLFIKAGADVNLVDGDGETPLHLAARYEDADIVRLLLERGAIVDQVNRYEETALHYAAVHGNTAVAKLLLERGANVNKVNHEGNTPLNYRLEGGDEVYPETMKLLLDSKADVNLADDHGYAPLHTAVVNIHETEVVKLLLQRGANVNQVNQDGETPLHSAASAGSIGDEIDETAKLLIKAGADLELVDADGKTPLSWARDANQRRPKEELSKFIRILEDALALKKLIGQVVGIYLKKLPFWQQAATTASGEELLKQKLFEIMYPRIDAFLSSYNNHDTRNSFIEKLAEVMKNIGYPTPVCFDGFLIQNNPPLAIGRAMSELSRDTANYLANFIPEITRHNGADKLFTSGYNLETEIKRRIQLQPAVPNEAENEAFFKLKSNTLLFRKNKKNPDLNLKRKRNEGSRRKKEENKTVPSKCRIVSMAT